MSAATTFLASPIVRRLPAWPIPLEELQKEWQKAWSIAMASSQYQPSLDWGALDKVIHEALQLGRPHEIHLVVIATEKVWPTSGSRMVTEMRHIRILINTATHPQLGVSKAPMPLQTSHPIWEIRRLAASSDPQQWMPLIRQPVTGDLDQAIAKLEDDVCRGPVTPASNRR
jgi:hypothetical protein